MNDICYNTRREARAADSGTQALRNRSHAAFIAQVERLNPKVNAIVARSGRFRR
jgi:hypothetical protein